MQNRGNYTKQKNKCIEKIQQYIKLRKKKLNTVLALREIYKDQFFIKCLQNKNIESRDFIDIYSTTLHGEIFTPIITKMIENPHFTQHMKSCTQSEYLTLNEQMNACKSARYKTAHKKYLSKTKETNANELKNETSMIDEQPLSTDESILSSQSTAIKESAPLSLNPKKLTGGKRKRNDFENGNSSVSIHSTEPETSSKSDGEHKTRTFDSITTAFKKLAYQRGRPSKKTQQSKAALLDELKSHPHFQACTDPEGTADHDEIIELFNIILITRDHDTIFAYINNPRTIEAFKQANPKAAKKIHQQLTQTYKQRSKNRSTISLAKKTIYALPSFAKHKFAQKLHCGKQHVISGQETPALSRITLLELAQSTSSDKWDDIEKRLDDTTIADANQTIDDLESIHCGKNILTFVLENEDHDLFMKFFKRGLVTQTNLPASSQHPRADYYHTSNAWHALALMPDSSPYLNQILQMATQESVQIRPLNQKAREYQLTYLAVRVFNHQWNLVNTMINHMISKNIFTLQLLLDKGNDSFDYYCALQELVANQQWGILTLIFSHGGSIKKEVLSFEVADNDGIVMNALTYIKQHHPALAQLLTSKIIADEKPYQRPPSLNLSTMTHSTMFVTPISPTTPTQSPRMEDIDDYFSP